MTPISRLSLTALLCAAPAFATVKVTSPLNGASVTSPAAYVATASSSTCSKGVASMGVYVNNVKIYVVKGASLNTSVTLKPGAQHTVIEEWDKCGGATTYTANVTVGAAATTTVNLSASPAAISVGGSSTLTASATNASSVTIKGSDNTSYSLAAAGGSVIVTPAATTTYTATAVGASTTATASKSVTVSPASTPLATVSISANPTSIEAGGSSTLTVVAANATTVTITGSDSTSYTLNASGGTQVVTPSATTTYTAEAIGANGNATAESTVSLVSSSGLSSISHVVFMLQENHSFDDYFGMLNPYRKTHGFDVGDDGKEYDVDGIDDKLETIVNDDDEGNSYKLFKLASTCIDDDSSAWESSYGDVNRYNFLTSRPIKMDGFVHTAEGFAKGCTEPGATCSGAYTDQEGRRSMGYYDEDFLNYYYYMASQFAVSDRWFSPIASKSIDNRIATFTGGTTQGLVQDPGGNDKLSQLPIATIFNELDKAHVSWKIYYTVTQGFCLDPDDCPGTAYDQFPATDFGSLSYSFNYLRENHGSCIAPMKASGVVGDATNSFCVDPDHIAPLSTYFSDLTNGTLPSFAFIEAGFGHNDEHPGSGQSVLNGQAQVAKVMNAFMASPVWKNSVFFLAYDEGGGPYDHVPPVPGHSNDNTNKSLGTIPDIASVSVSPDGYKPCYPVGGVRTFHCDLTTEMPGSHTGDAPTVEGFGAQLGFRVPNMIVSPFARRHFVSHTPMDHTAIIKFVENRFIGPSTHLTARDAAQPNLLEFFDFSGTPWAGPPTPPTPVTAATLGYNPCTPTALGP